MKENLALRVAGTVFALVALGHLVRLVLQATIIVAGHTLPMSVSYIGLIIALALCVWMFAASKK